MPEFPRWEHWRPSAYGDYDDNNSKQQPDTAEFLQAILLGIELQRPKPKAPRLKAATPEACGEFIRQWGAFAESGTAVELGI